jgi:hypothetical protein
MVCQCFWFNMFWQCFWLYVLVVFLFCDVFGLS